MKFTICILLILTVLVSIAGITVAQTIVLEEHFPDDPAPRGWLTGGTQEDVIAEAHLDPDAIFAGVKRFADERDQRISGQSAALDALTN